jgi:hypothetical protein
VSTHEVCWKLDIITGGSFEDKTTKERREILDGLLENSSLLTCHNEPHQELESIHESLSAAEPEPLTSTSQDSFVEACPEPQTRREKKFHLQSPLPDSRLIILYIL